MININDERALLAAFHNLLKVQRYNCAVFFLLFSYCGFFFVLVTVRWLLVVLRMGTSKIIIFLSSVRNNCINLIVANSINNYRPINDQ